MDDGYGMFWFRGKVHLVHRVSLMLAGIEIPEGMNADHMCRNRGCVNTEHLRIVTPRVNTLENNDCPHAINARKTHCVNGHEFTVENTYRTKQGHRNCRACMAANAARYKAARKAVSLDR